DLPHLTSLMQGGMEPIVRRMPDARREGVHATPRFDVGRIDRLALQDARQRSVLDPFGHPHEPETARVPSLPGLDVDVLVPAENRNHQRREEKNRNEKADRNPEFFHLTSPLLQRNE